MPGFGMPRGFGQIPAQLPWAFDQLGNMLGAFRQGQIPPLPTSSPGVPQSGAPPRFDATGLLRLMMGNPQLQQALQSAAVLGQAGARSVGLPVPSGEGVRTVQIPLGAAVSTIHTLAERALDELNASSPYGEAEMPEYLLSEEGDFVVDPASPEERAALVSHLFRMSGEAARRTVPVEMNDEADEAEVWAREAGFTMAPAGWERNR
jgi:hypothetical protein